MCELNLYMLHNYSIPVQLNLRPKRHLPDSLPARDYGAEAALWLDKYLGLEGCRLVYAAPDLDKRIMGECEKRFFDLARADEKVIFNS